MSGLDDAEDATLRARLRESDPAASLPPADPHRVARLMEDVMSTELTTESRETGTHGRSPLTWLVAAAAVLIIAGVGAFGLLNHDSEPDAPPPAAADHQTVTELTAPGPEADQARCMVPNAEILGGQSLAFDGTVASLADGAVTLTPTHWYAGDPTDLVRVRAPAAQLRELVGAVRFRDGGRYLVSATDGRVSVCGLSAPYSAKLADLYERAFAR